MNSRILRFVLQSWQIPASFFLAFSALAYVAWGATYNFYFNNTEQGDNSTATPSVSVSGDGKVVKKPALSATDDPGSAAAKDGSAPAARPDAVVTPPAKEISSAEAATAQPQEPGVSHWRVGLGVSASQTYLFGPLNSYQPQPALSFSYFLNRDIGFTLFGAKLADAATNDGMTDENTVITGNRWLAGAQVEFVPIHVTLGRFEDLVDLGLVAGVEVETETLSDTFENTAAPAAWNVLPEAGVRLGINLGRTWSILSEVRANSNYAAAETALAIRF